MNEKGDVIINLIMVPITIIVLVIVFTMLDPFTELLNSTIDNSAAVSYGTSIKLLIGAVGILIVLLWIASLVRDFRDDGRVVYQ